MRLDHIDIPDALANEVEQRLPNATWQTIIIDAITFAMTMADTEQPDSEPSDADASIPVEQT